MAAKFARLLMWLSFVLNAFAEGRRHHKDNFYSNSWVVFSSRGSEYIDELAQRYGFINRGQVGSLDGFYILEHKTYSNRLRRSIESHTANFLLDPHIRHALQQKILRRSKREFTDPLYVDQWYLNNSGQTPGPKGFDINVAPVWKKNISGRGVVVTILDDGIEYTHPDLKKNYYAKASYDFNSHDDDPFPKYTRDNINKHGTRCAGEVAADVNNNICGVGVAYNARIGGVRMLDGDVTDAVEGGSLSHAREFIDIYSSSWGPDDDGLTVDGPGPLARKAFREGIRKGRKGLGSIFVWATGNGGHVDDYCNCDGYITSIFTISIGAVNDQGKSPWYAEACPSTLAVAYSSGKQRGPDKQIITTDLHHKCTISHTGTSAAAPLAAGIFALVLEANPKLTWRDLQHLIVNTSRKTDSGDRDWQVNGARYHVNNKYGFGVLDSAALVNAATAANWKTAAEQHMCREQERTDNQKIPSQGTFTSSIYSTGCFGKRDCVTKLEHVRVYVTLSHRRRGSLKITLISPMGTKSLLLAPRERDLSRDGFNNWPFMTVFLWGENPHGVWTLKVQDTKGQEGKFTKWSLRLYGTCDNNRELLPNESKICEAECKKGCPVSFSEKCVRCWYYCNCDTGSCVPACSDNQATDHENKHCRRDLEDEQRLDQNRKGGKSQGSGLGQMSTFVKWLIIFIMLAVLVAAVMIMWLCKVSERFCWSKPKKKDKAPVKKDVVYSRVSVTPEVNSGNLKELGNLHNPNLVT